MPELPEVETVCRGLRPVVTGQVIARVAVRRRDLRHPFPAGLKRHLESRRMMSITRRAKYILIHLDNGYVLVIHLGMSGRLVLYPASYKPKTHDHFILYLADGRQIVLNDARRFGLVDLVAVDDLDSHGLFSHLGPEPLSRNFSGAVLGRALAGRTAAIKQAIMDQRLVVGVGNIYASEALFQAGIDPQIPAGMLRPAQCAALAGSIKKVLQQAIKAGGSTLRDHRQATGEQGYFQHHFMVYDRAGAPCPRCSSGGCEQARIVRIIQGGRASFYCPDCQK